MGYLHYFLIGILCFSFLLFFSGLYFYHTAIKRSKKAFIEEEPFLHELYKNLNIQIEWLQQQNVESIEITSYDHLKLHGKILKAPIQTNKVVILVHGYSSRGEDMAGFAHLFHEKYSYHVVMPDLRGHGNSEGNYIGFGWHDRLDLLKWIYYTIKQFGNDVDIVLLGISMGGATVLMTSGETLPKNVKLIVSDCAYDSIDNILSYQTKRMYKLPKFPMIHITSFITRLRAKYHFKQGKAYEQVRKSQIPILFIHGGSDDFVPTQMVYHLFENANEPKKLLVVENAGHGEAYDTNPALYEKTLEDFLEKYAK